MSAPVIHLIWISSFLAWQLPVCVRRLGRTSVNQARTVGRQLSFDACKSWNMREGRNSKGEWSSKTGLPCWMCWSSSGQWLPSVSKWEHVIAPGTFLIWAISFEVFVSCGFKVEIWGQVGAFLSFLAIECPGSSSTTNWWNITCKWCLDVYIALRYICGCSCLEVQVLEVSVDWLGDHQVLLFFHTCHSRKLRDSPYFSFMNVLQ